jgi:hypothetical protein
MLHNFTVLWCDRSVWGRSVIPGEGHNPLLKTKCPDRPRAAPALARSWPRPGAWCSAARGAQVEPLRQGLPSSRRAERRCPRDPPTRAVRRRARPESVNASAATPAAAPPASPPDATDNNPPLTPPRNPTTTRTTTTRSRSSVAQELPSVARMRRPARVLAADNEVAAAAASARWVQSSSQHLRYTHMSGAMCGTSVESTVALSS